MLKFVLMSSLGLSAVAGASSVTLVARANLENGFRLPPGSFIDNASPVMNDKGSVAFKVLSFLDNQSGVVLVPASSEGSKLVHAAGPELYLTDVSLTEGMRSFLQNSARPAPSESMSTPPDRLPKF